MTQTILTASPRSTACTAIVPPIPSTSSSGCAAKTRTRRHPSLAPTSRRAGAGLDLFEEERALSARDDRPLVAARHDRARRSRSAVLDGTGAPDDDLLVAEERERPGIRPRLRADPVVEVGRARLPVDDPVARGPLRPRARALRILRARGSADPATICGTYSRIRSTCAVASRSKSVVAVSSGAMSTTDLPDDRTGVCGGIDDLEQRHAGPRQAREDRPRDRCASAMTRQQRRVHAEDALPRERDERVAHELRPADDEDQLRIEGSDGRQRLVGVDVRRLDDLRAEPGRNLVERALARAVRVDGPGQRDDADDVRARHPRPPRGSRARSMSKLTQTVRIAERC